MSQKDGKEDQTKPKEEAETIVGVTTVSKTGKSGERMDGQ